MDKPGSDTPSLIGEDAPRSSTNSNSAGSDGIIKNLSTATEKANSDPDQPRRATVRFTADQVHHIQNEEDLPEVERVGSNRRDLMQAAVDKSGSDQDHKRKSTRVMTRDLAQALIDEDNEEEKENERHSSTASTSSHLMQTAIEKAESDREFKRASTRSVTRNVALALMLKADGDSFLRKGDFEEAIEAYTEAIDVDPGNSSYLLSRSAVYLKSGNYAKALDDVNDSIALDPSNLCKAYCVKGEALVGLKQYDNAMAAYQEGVDKFPNSMALQDGLDDAKKCMDADQNFKAQEDIKVEPTHNDTVDSTHSHDVDQDDEDHVQIISTTGSSINLTRQEAVDKNKSGVQESVTDKHDKPVPSTSVQQESHQPVQMEALNEEERTANKIHKLQTILADDTIGIVKRYKAKAELDLLQKQNRPKKIRKSLGAISGGVVAKNTEQVERDLKRIEEVRRREGALLAKIKRLKEEFLAGAADRSAERKRQLEEQLRAVAEEIEALKLEKVCNEDDSDESPTITSGNIKSGKGGWTKIKSLAVMIQLMEEQEKASEERIKTTDEMEALKLEKEGNDNDGDESKITGNSIMAKANWTKVKSLAVMIQLMEEQKRASDEHIKELDECLAEEQFKAIGEEIEALELETKTDDEEVDSVNDSSSKMAKMRWSKVKKSMAFMIKLLEEQEKESEKRIKGLDEWLEEKLLAMKEEEENNANDDILFGDFNKVQVGGIAMLIALMLWWFEVPVSVVEVPMIVIISWYYLDCFTFRAGEEGGVNENQISE